MSDIIIKIFGCDGTGMVRRRKFDSSSVTLAQVQAIANLQSNAKLTWKDEDGDSILVETQSDLQEAIVCAATQNSSLRLFVDNAKTSSTPTISPTPTTSSEPTREQPTPEQQTPEQPPLDLPGYVESLLASGRRRLLSAVNRARSAFDTSSTLQAIKEDSSSIRAVFEARVERNLDAIPIRPITSFVVHAILVWALVSPTFWLLSQIAMGAILMPRNALSPKTSQHILVFLPLLSIRVAMWMFFGFTTLVTCCVLPKIMFAVFLVCCAKKCSKRHRHRKGKYMYRHLNRRNVPRAPQEGGVTQEQSDIDLLRKIFPSAHIDHLTQEYLRHRDVQKTVLELLK